LFAGSDGGGRGHSSSYFFWKEGCVPVFFLKWGGGVGSTKKKLLNVIFF